MEEITYNFSAMDAEGSLTREDIYRTAIRLALETETQPVQTKSLLTSGAVLVETNALPKVSTNEFIGFIRRMGDTGTLGARIRRGLILLLLGSAVSCGSFKSVPFASGGGITITDITIGPVKGKKTGLIDV
jgi:hypothetical protein